jgi:5-methylthioribose kinase
MNIEAHDELVAYLWRQGHVVPEETPRIRTLPDGVSNRTVLVEFAGGDAWVLKQALAKLRVASDWYCDPVRIHREALGMKYLHHLAPAGTITELIFEDPAEHLLAMRAVPQPHENWKHMLLAGRIEKDHVEQFAKLLAIIHLRAAQQATELKPLFADTSFFESLRVEPYYVYSAQQVPEARAFLERLIAEKRVRRLTLVHGDYSPKNILVHDDRLILLDHEVIHWGDPAFDVGFALTHLLSKAHHLSQKRSQFASAARQFFRMYCWSDDIEVMAVRHTLGCMLARVAGRSPLEYLNESERNRQRGIVVVLMRKVPASVDALIEGFVSQLERHGDD